MNNTYDVLWFLGIVGLLNAVALTYLAFRLRAPVQVTVHTLAPHSVLPPELMDTLSRVNEKLSPPAHAMESSKLTELVHEGVVLAAQPTGIKGSDRFRTARSYVLQMAKAQNITVDERALALQIEANVATRKAQKK